MPVEPPLSEFAHTQAALREATHGLLDVTFPIEESVAEAGFDPEAFSTSVRPSPDSPLSRRILRTTLWSYCPLEIDRDVCGPSPTRIGMPISGAPIGTAHHGTDRFRQILPGKCYRPRSGAAHGRGSAYAADTDKTSLTLRQTRLQPRVQSDRAAAYIYLRGWALPDGGS